MDIAHATIDEDDTPDKDERLQSRGIETPVPIEVQLLDSQLSAFLSFIQSLREIQKESLYFQVRETNSNLRNWVCIMIIYSQLSL